MRPFALARWRFTNCCGHSWGHPTTPHTSEGAPDGGSRRDFLKTAAAGVAGLAASGSLPARTAAHNRVKHSKDAPERIRVVGADGRALPALREIAKICAQQKLVLCTGHASPTEVLAIVEAARDAGCDRVVVTHAEFDVVNMSVEQMK